MLKTCRCLLLFAALGGGLAGCATTDDNPGAADVTDATPSPTRSPADIQKISELERQLLREQRQCVADKRRLELSLKDSQKQIEELQKKYDDLQKKLDALLIIDRDLRNRSRSR
ncbi:MAG: hypothetical protein H6R14_1194 [Proteobacteria bacterium]|nr:hypothetical protein [Pseudomonadota bacterium]